MRVIFNPSTGNIEPADNVTSPLKPLGEKFKFAELTNMNTPDLEQSPDSFLRPGETLEDWDVSFRRANAYGGLQREGFLKAGFVGRKSSPNYKKWLIKDFYSKSGEGKFANPDGTKNRNAYFNSKDEALEAIRTRKIETGLGLTDEEMTKKYKKELKKRGYNTWGEAPDNIRASISSNVTSEGKSRYQKIGRSPLNKKTKRLLDLHNPVNPSTGLPYTYDEFAKLSPGVRDRIMNEMQGKPRRSGQGWAKREGWLPEKEANRLLVYLKEAAKQQKELKIPLKDRTFIEVYEMDGTKRKFVGVRDVKNNTLWTHVGYDLSKPGAKKGTSIAAQKNGKFVHPDMERFLTFFDEAQKFKYDRPTKLLGNYFSQYSKVPTYNEIYNFFTMHAGTKPHTLRKLNALTVHHQNLMRNKPTKNFQLLINKFNSKADNILRDSLKKPGEKGHITKAEAIRKLKEIGARVEGMGISASEITPKKGLALAKKEAVKKFREGIKKNPQIVEQMALRLGLDKKQKIKLNSRVNSGIPIDDMIRMIASDFKIPLRAVGSVVGKVLKVGGIAATPLDLIPFAEAEEMGLEPGGATSWKMLGETYANLPRIIEDLTHVASDEGTWKTFGSKEDKDRVWKGHAEFGKRSALREIKNTSLDVLLQRLDNISQGKPDLWDKAMSSLIGDPTGASLTIATKGRTGKSPEKIKRLKNQLIETKRMVDSWDDNDPRLYTVTEKFKETPIKPVENVFGTQVPMESITEGFSRDQFLAKGGRVGFEEGTIPDDKSDEDILNWIKNQMFELEQGWNTGKSLPGKIMDVARVDNWPYYAARMLKAGMNVAEVSAKLPFVGIDLIGKLATQPAFRMVDAPPNTDIDPVAEIALNEKVNEGYADSWLTDQPQKKLEGTGLFTEAFKDLMPGAFSEKTGLNSLIEGMEEKMKAQGQSNWGEIAGKNIELGLDVTLPFGYVAAANKYKSLKKVLTPLVKNKDVNKVIEKALTDKGMSRREFNTLLASGGIIAALKALGIDSLFKGTRLAKDLKTAPIKMLKNTSTKMPVWFPKFIENIQKKMTYEGNGMWGFKGTDDFLPGYHIEKIHDDYYITGKNDYGQEFQITYETPRWEGDPDGISHYYKGDFKVDDIEPVHMDPDGNVDFDGIVRDDIDEVLGGTTAMENVATKTTRKSLTKGEEKVLDAEMRAQSEYDIAKDEGLLDDIE